MAKARKQEPVTDWRSIEDEREKYSAYLCSREWGVLKRQVHERAGGKCERCKVNPIDAVHHLTYERKYAERLEDIQANCNGCHQFTHGHSDEDPARELHVDPVRMDSESNALCPICDSPHCKITGMQDLDLSKAIHFACDKGHFFGLICTPRFLKGTVNVGTIYRGSDQQGFVE